MPRVNLDSVSKFASGPHSKKILDNISIEIASEQITALVGQSGAGKSTLLRLINALSRPTSGKVSIDGRALDYTSSLKAHRLKIGYAVQGVGLFPHLSVAKNITLLAELNPANEIHIKERCHYLLSMVGLGSEYQDRYPYQLSGGERQRVGLCRAMMLKPPLLLLDEAFAALDPSTRSDIHNKLLAIQKAEPRTIVLVTHDMNEAAKLAQYTAVLKAGRLVAFDSTKKVLKKKNLFENE